MRKRNASKKGFRLLQKNFMASDARPDSERMRSQRRPETAFSIPDP